MNLLLSVLFATISMGVEPTKIIDSGSIVIHTAQGEADTVDVSMDYYLKMRWFAPVPDQRGTLRQNLPIEMIQESGYQDLAANGPKTYRDVVMTDLGRSDANGFLNSYQARVEKIDHSWSAVVYYHPTIDSTGWSRMELTLNNIPALGSYTIVANLIH